MGGTLRVDGGEGHTPGQSAPVAPLDPASLHVTPCRLEAPSDKRGGNSQAESTVTGRLLSALLVFAKEFSG